MRERREGGRREQGEEERWKDHESEAHIHSDNVVATLHNVRPLRVAAALTEL